MAVPDSVEASHTAPPIHIALDAIRVGPPEIPANQITFDSNTDRIGKGAFGFVYAGNLCD